MPHQLMMGTTVDPLYLTVPLNQLIVLFAQEMAVNPKISLNPNFLKTDPILTEINFTYRLTNF